jgi:Ca-activated chloride channel family protein
VPAGGTQRVRVVYEHLLTGDANRIDYVLPRSESLEAGHPWSISIDVQSRHAISTLYSPTHELNVKRLDAGSLTATVGANAPGPFRLSVLRDRGDMSASLFAYPDPEVGGGYFLLMAGLPARPAAARPAREVTIVIDRSGSMAGEKMDQVRAAARHVIDGLDDGESFNIIDYSSTVSMLAATPVVKDARSAAMARRYLDTISPGGGTNIHDALLEALRQKHDGDAVPIVLFLTDGLPTIGRTDEVAIRDMVATANRHGRRVFTIGVGADVNAPLLDAIADRTRGTASFVGPRDTVETTMAHVFRQLHGPIFSRPVLATADTSGATATHLVYDVLPDAMPDLYEGDQLIVLGRYREDRPMSFRFTGDYLGAERTFAFTFNMDATTRNAFVPRLWASRRIATLVDAVRQAPAGVADPRSGELVDEILKLSTRFGILTEYTAFLATDGTPFDDWEELRNGCHGRLSERAVATRSGWGAINQSINYRRQAGQVVLNYRNAFVDEHLQPVEFDTVRQVSDLAFFRRGPHWVDSRLVALGNVQPHETVMIGSEEHRALMRRLRSAGRHGVLALSGQILLLVDDRIVLVTDGC